KAPVLITKDMVAQMKAGSVIIDLASAAGGNCELSKDNETITVNDIIILGNSNLPAQKPQDASRMYAKNMLNLLSIMIKDGEISLNFDDDIIKGSCITHGGSVIWEPLNKK